MPEEKDQVSVTPETPVVSKPAVEPGAQGEPADPKDAIIKNVRSEAASWRVKFQNLNKKIEDMENKSKLDEMESTKRLETIAQQAEAKADRYAEQAKKATVNSAAYAEASVMGFRNPKLAVGYINLSSVAVDDDGNADTEAINLQLRALAESDPYTLHGKEQPKTPIQRGQFGPASPAAPGFPPADRQFASQNRVQTDTAELMRGQIGTQEFFHRAADAFEQEKKLNPAARGADILDKGG